MAHLPKEFLSSPFSSGDTLFLPAEPGTLGVLVTQRSGRYAARSRRFHGGPAAALAWCLANRVGLVLFWGQSPAVN